MSTARGGSRPPRKEDIGVQKCNLCHKSFTTSFCRKLHEHVHKSNSFKCEISLKRCAVCNKSFEKEYLYKFHKRHFHLKKGSNTTTFFPSWYTGESRSTVDAQANAVSAARSKIQSESKNRYRLKGLSRFFRNYLLQFKEKMRALGLVVCPQKVTPPEIVGKHLSKICFEFLWKSCYVTDNG